MLDFGHLTQSALGAGNYQVFNANGNTQQEFVKPRGIDMLGFLVLASGGGGGGGSSGLTSTVRGGGGAGGGGGLVVATFPALILPDLMYLYVGTGGVGGAAGQAGSGGVGNNLVNAYPSSSNAAVAGSTFIQVNKGGTGNFGTTVGGSASAGGGTVAQTAGGSYAMLALNWSNSAGSAGLAGGTNAAATIPWAQSIAFTPSGGGSGCDASNVDFTFAGTAASGFLPALTAPSGAGAAGFDGWLLSNPFWPVPAIGGNSNAAGTGGKGGKGALGGGGGGGGGGITGGAGGDGGDGVTYVFWW